jgi:hypothetical protein
MDVVQNTHALSNRQNWYKVYSNFTERWLESHQTQDTTRRCIMCHMEIKYNGTNPDGLGWSTRFCESGKCYYNYNKLREKYRAKARNAIRFKTNKFCSITGLHRDDMIRYIEQKFIPEMTWDNYKTVWELDHIIPMAWFDMTIPEEVVACCHHTNLQPMLKTENSQKNATLLCPKLTTNVISESSNDMVATSTYTQLFAIHCLLSPIYIWASDKLMELDAAGTKKSSSTVKTYNSIINKMNKYLITYAEGVPEFALSNICNDLRVDITIDMPLGKNPVIYVKSIQKCLRTFNFLNARLNIDVSSTQMFAQLLTAGTPIELSQLELNTMLKTLAATNEFCIYTKHTDGVKSITTIHGKYRVFNKP